MTRSSTRLSASSQWDLGYQRGLAGLRGIAIVVVVLHNFGWTGFQGGFVGVDLFFALSGFLITTLLMEEYARDDRINWPRFMVRRFRRLYPALLVLSVVSLVFGAIRNPDIDGSDLMRVGIAVLAYVPNWVIIADSSAWFGGLPHTWSLGVEMQFYLGWSLVVILLVRVTSGGSWRLAYVAGILAVGGFIWRILLGQGGEDWTRIYAGTDTRIDSVLWGAWAAAYRLGHVGEQKKLPWWLGQRTWVRGIELGFLLGLAGITVFVPTEINSWSLCSFGLTGLGGALVILTMVMSPHSLLNKWCSPSGLVWVGTISYSLYLWHLPAAKLLGVDGSFGGWGRELLALGMSVGLAALSYYGVEARFRRSRRSSSARSSM